MSSPPPRRRHSAAVYRRRRITVLVLLLAVIVGVWMLIAQPWRASGEPAPQPTSTSAKPPSPDATAIPAPSNGAVTPGPESTPTPSAKPTATPKPSPTATAVAACDPDNIDVVPLTDQTTYAAGQQPGFSIQLTNKGKSNCLFNVGTSTQKFVVTSGDDTWWRSTDCQEEPSDTEVTLGAGQTVTSVDPIVWDRTRSKVSTCDAKDRPRAPGAGASYHLSVSIGGVTSAKTTQFLLY